jgi:chemotaxis signal transduction protein
MDINSTLSPPSPLAAESEFCRAVVFTIAGHLLALPITAIHRVMITPTLLNINSNGVSLVHLSGLNITVLDLHPQLSAVKPTSFNFFKSKPENKKQFLIVTYSQQGMLNGILVDAPPTIIELPLSAIRVFPRAYRQATPLGIASHITVIPQEIGTLTIFLLDINHLLELFVK